MGKVAEGIVLYIFLSLDFFKYLAVLFFVFNKNKDMRYM
jgi:hypothetical protein